MSNHLHALTINQMQSLDINHRLVIIHPMYLHGHLTLTHFDYAKTVYVCLTGANLNGDQVNEQIRQRLDDQDTRLAVQPNLILDEYDRIALNVRNKSLKTLLKDYPNLRIFILSRTIPAHLIRDEDLRFYSTFIPNDSNALLWDYAQNPSDKLLLEVHSFGEGRVRLDGQLIRYWDGVLPRALFFYMIDRGMTTRNEIFDVFWPDLSVREATNVFHVTKRKINEILGVDLAVYSKGYYRISPKLELSYDVVRFSELVQQGTMDDNENRISLLHQAVGLYQGEFLSTINMAWVIQRRRELSQDYSDSLGLLAEYSEGQNALDEALGLYIRAAFHFRQDEEFTAKVMHLYRQRGMLNDALKAYECLKHELKDMLNASPNDSIQQLAADILQELSSRSSITPH